MFDQGKRSLSELFDTPVQTNKNSYFQVPNYQRKYQWEKDKQVAKLIDDIFENIGQPYFMGPLILCSGPIKELKTSGDSVQIIDGQQRLATFALFIRALVDYLKKRIDTTAFSSSLNDDAHELRTNLKNKIVKGILKKNEVVIHLAKRIDNFFTNEILLTEMEKIEGLKAKRSAEHPSIMKLIDAYIKMYERLEQEFDSYSGEKLLLELTTLANSLLDEKLFLTITVTNKSVAYTIFETINQRGKPLTLSDLVKNLCFEKLSSLGESNLDDFEEDWDEAEIAVSDFASFIWHAWVSRFKPCRKDKVFDTISNHVKNMTEQKVFDFASDLIFDDTKSYHIYENPSEESDPKKKQYLEMLKKMDATRCYPLLLGIDFAVQKKIISQKIYIDILKAVTNLTFWYSGICSRDAKKLETEYHQLAHEAREIKKEEQQLAVTRIIDQLNSLVPSRDECKSNFTTRTFTDTTFIKMLLYNIELEYHDAETTLKSTKIVHLEHILPKSPDKSWHKPFEQTKKNMKDYTYRMGNFTLLYGPKNSEIKNKPFSEKREQYKGSKCNITKALANIEQWNADEIDKRSIVLFEMAEKRWPIGGQ